MEIFDFSSMDVTALLATMVLGYLLGSIPFGYLLTKLTGGGDLRTIGSGNIGATNVLRTGKKGLAAATLLLDMGKGATAVCIARYLPGNDLPLAGFMAVIGHCFPVWLKFKGGKGVATIFGVCLALDWRIGLAYAVVWLAVLAITRISSLAGMSAAIAAPIAAFVTLHELYCAMLITLAALVLYLHRSNIRRLIAGTEPRVGTKA